MQNIICHHYFIVNICITSDNFSSQIQDLFSITSEFSVIHLVLPAAYVIPDIVLSVAPPERILAISPGVAQSAVLIPLLPFCLGITLIFPSENQYSPEMRFRASYSESFLTPGLAGNLRTRTSLNSALVFNRAHSCSFTS